MKRLYKMRHFLKDEVSFKKLMLLLLFSIGTLSSVLAGTINFSATLSSNQLFYRPRPGSSVCGGYYGTFTSISANSTTQYAYATQSFTVSTAGNYSITVTSTTASDPMLLIYNSFSPSSPNSNFKVGDDDSGSGLNSSISGCNNYFAAGTYTIVVTSYSSNTRSGTVYFSISGDGVSAASVKLLPTVSTNSASSISSTGATLGGNVTNDGGATVTARGIAYGTSSNPTTGAGVTGTTGSFSTSVTGLTPGTTYYARAYATNSVGTAYGPQISFTTQSYTPPSVTTNTTTSIGETTASFNGNVTNTGGQNVTRGFQYSTSSSFSGATTRTLSGTQGTGSFSYDQTGLAGSTRYYVRAWASNDGGTTYGSSTSFYTDHTVTYTAGSNGSLSGTTTQVVDHGGSTSSVSSIPDAGYHFVQWSDYSTSNPRSDANVTSSFTRTASFAVNSFRFAVQPTNRVAGVGNTFTVEAIDNLGNRVTNSDRAISVAVKKADGTTVQTLSGTLSSGVVTIAEPIITLTGNYYLTVSDAGGGTNGTFSALNSSTFTITPAAINYFTVAGITDPHEAGETTSPTVTAYDEYDNVKYDYTGSIEFSTDNVSPNTNKPTELPANYTFTSGDQGMKTFSNGVSLKEYGSTYYVKVNDITTTTAEGQQNDISVYTAELNYYQLKALSNTATYPSDNNVIVGSDFSVLAELYDEFGNKKVDFTGDLDVTFSTNASPSPLGNTIVKPATGAKTFTAGEAIISGFTLYNAQETPTITINETLTGSEGSTSVITVWPEELDNFLVQESPTQNNNIGGVRQTATVPFSVTVTARDQYNNIKRDYDGSIKFKASNDFIVDYPTGLQKYDLTDAGIVTYTNSITIPTIGAYWLRVGDSSDPTKTGELQNIIVGPYTQDASNSELIFASYPTVTTYPSTPVVVAGDYIPVTITPRDAGDNLLCDCQTVSVLLNGVDEHHDGSLVNGVPALVTIPVVDNHDGTYSASVRVTDMSQTNEITAIVNGTTLSTTLSVEVAEPDAPSLEVSTITPAVNSITTDENTVVTLQLKDQFGNNRTTNDGTITFNTTEGGFETNNGDATNYEATYDVNGAYTATLYASYDATTHGVGTATISTEADFTDDVNHTDGAFTEQPTVEITEGLPDLTTSTILASDDQISTDETSDITVQLKDHLGNLIQNDRGTVTLYTTLGTLGSSSGSQSLEATYTSAGAYTATLYGTQNLPVNGVGTADITALLEGDGSAAAVSGTLNDGASTPSNTIEQVVIFEGLPDVTTIDISVADTEITADDTTVVTVQLKDQFGNLIVNDRGMVTLSTSPIGVIDNGTSQGATTIEAIYDAVGDSGTYIATFKLADAGTGLATITGAITYNNGSEDVTEDIDDNATVNVLPGLATQLAIETQPAHSTTEAIAGVAFSTQPQVSVQDQWGNIVVADDTTTIHAATGSTGTDELFGTLSATVVDGIATFSGLNYEVEEDMNIEFTSGSLTTVTSNTLTVVHNVPDYMVITGTGSQIAGTSQEITITVYDEYDNVATRFDGAKSLTFSGATGSPTPEYVPTAGGTEFGSATSLAFTDGVATIAMVLYKEEEAYIQANHSADFVDASYTGTTAISIDATDGEGFDDGLDVSVSQAGAAYLAVTGSATQTAGVAQDITITAYDAFNNVATNYTGEKSLTFSGAASSDGTPSVNPTVAATDFGAVTSATFTDGTVTLSMILYKDEAINVDVNDGSIDSEFTHNSTGYDYGLDVDADNATAAYLALDNGDGTGWNEGAVTAGTDVAVGINAYDQYNNLALDYDGTKSLTFADSGDPIDQPFYFVTPEMDDTQFDTGTDIPFTNGEATAIMNLFTVRNDNITVSDGTINSEITIDETDYDYSLDATVNHAAADRLSVRLETASSPLTAGDANTIVVTAYDAYNNIATGYAGTTIRFNGASNSVDSDVPEVDAVDFGSNTPLSFTDGIATASMTLYTAETGITIAAADWTSGSEGIKSESLDFDSNTYEYRLALDVDHNNATQLRIDTEPSTYVRAGDALATQPVISIRDAYGNITTADDTTVIVASINTGTSELVGTDTITASNGTVTYTNLSYEIMETISIDFDANPELTTVTSNNITVDHNATDYYVYISTPNYIYAGGQRGAFTVKRFDAFDNEVNNLVLSNGDDSSDPEIVYLYSSSSDVSSTFFNVETGGSALDTIRITDGNVSKNFWYFSQYEGIHTISASDNAMAADNANGIDDADYDLEVKPAALKEFIVSGVGEDVGEGWTEHYYGDRQSVTVEAIDIYGNRKINYTGTITFSLTDAEASEYEDAGYNYPHDYTFTVADSGIHTFTDAILFERPTFEHPQSPDIEEWWVTVVDQDQPGKYGSQHKIKVLARPLIITAHNQTKEYYGDSYDLGSTEFTVTSGISSYVDPNIYAGDDSITNVSLISGGTAEIATVGDYDIVPDNATGINGIDTSYYDITYVNGTLNVEPRPITITVDAGQNKVYSNDSNTDPTFTFSTVYTGDASKDSLVNGDEFTGALTREPGEDVGFYDILQAGLVISYGTDKTANYAIAFEKDSLEITRYPLALSNFVVDNKVYDATDTAYISSFETDLISGDELTFDTTANFVSRHVNWDGNSALDTTVFYEITISGGADAGNYLFATDGENDGSATIWMDSTLATISQYPINVTAVTDTKTYDGTTSSDETPVVDALWGDDLVTSEGAQVYDSENVGTGKTLSASGAVINDGNSGNNYAISYVDDNTGEISKRALTVSVDTDQSKTYGDLDPDSYTYTITSGSLATGDSFTGELSRDAGETVASYTVNKNTLTIVNGSSVNTESNYEVTFDNANTFDIEQLAVTVTAAAKSKVYGETDPALTFASTPVVNYVLANDSIVEFIGALARVSGEDVGFYHINQGSLDNSNYNITYELDSLEIQQLDVTVTANANQTKTYGDLDPVLAYTSSPAVGTILTNNEIIGFFGELDRIAGEDVGFYHIGQGTLDNLNYNITYKLDSLEIQQLDVAITADADQSKTYGNVDPALAFTSNPVVGSSLANSELISYTGVLEREAGENVGDYAISQGTLDNSNYNITYNGDSFAINQLDVTVTADANQSKTYGESDPVYTYNSSPAVDHILANDSVIKFTGELSRAAGEDVNTYAYSLGTLSNSNYNITLTSGNFEITQRPITLVANNQTKTYGDGPEAGESHEDYWTLGTAEFTVSATEGDGVATGENIDGVTFTSAGEARLADIGSYTISIDEDSESGSGGFKLSNYDVSYVDATLTVETRILHLSNFAADNKVYDGTTTATGLGFDDDRVPGDNLSFQRDADFEDASVGTEKVVIYNSVTITGGADIANYVLESEREHWKTGANRIISAAPIVVTVVADDKEYDGTNEATVTLLGDFVDGDDVALSYTNATFANAEVGNDKAVIVTGIHLTGNDLGDYMLASATGSATADITAISTNIAVTGNTNFTYNGTAQGPADATVSNASSGTITYSYSGVDNNSSAYGPSVTPPTNAGNYQVVATIAAGGNYEGATSNAFDFTIQKADAVITVIPYNVNYDGTAHSSVFSALGVETNPVDLNGLMDVSGTTHTSAGDYSDDSWTFTGNSNYNADNGSVNNSIAKVSLSVTARNASKVYDGLEFNGGNGVNYSGFIIGEDQNDLEGTLTYNGTSQGAVNKGEYLITPSGLTSDNYEITFIDGILSVSSAVLTVSAKNDSKIYDGNVYSGGNGVTYNGFLEGEGSEDLTGTLTYSGNSQGASDAGSYVITPGGLSSNNYTIQYNSGTLTIAQEDLIIINALAQSKVYNGDLQAAITGAELSGFVNGDDVTLLNGTVGTFAQADVGKDISVNMTAALGGVDAGNYNLLQPVGLSADITAKTLMIDGTFTVNDKAFDGTSVVTIIDNALILTGVVNDDDVSLNAIASFNNADNGDDKVVDLLQSTLTGDDASNYLLSFNNAPTTTASILNKQVTISGSFTAGSKVYDGTNEASINNVSLQLDGVEFGDDVTLQVVAIFTDKNVGQGKTVTLVESSLNGNDASNYSLSSEGAPTAIANITAKTTTVTGAEAVDKAYDGTTGADIAGAVLVGAIPGDDVILTDADTGTFARAEVGTDIAVTTAMQLAGDDAGNYSLLQPQGLMADIIASAQSIELTAGWNMISVGLTPTGSAKLIDVLQPLIDAQRLEKVIDEKGRTIENLGNSWFESIGDLLFTEGYQVKVNQNTMLEIEGAPIQLPLNIELVPGWNMISFPALNEQNAMDVLQTLIDDGNLLKAMDEKGSSIEELAGNWYNFIGNFVPGKGYKVKVAQACTLTIYEANKSSVITVPKLLASTNFTPVFSGNGFNHMNIVLTDLYEAGFRTGDQIGIFDGDICVGATTIGDLSYLNNMISIPVSSHDGMTDELNGFVAGNNFSIRVLHENQEQDVAFNVINGSERFAIGATSVIAFSAELEITDVDGRISNAYGVKLYPNPFTTMMVIEIVQPEGDELEINIYDIQGRKVKTIDYGISTGHDKVRWDGNNQSGESVKPGLYYIRVNGKYSGNILKQ